MFKVEEVKKSFKNKEVLKIKIKKFKKKKVIIMNIIIMNLKRMNIINICKTIVYISCMILCNSMKRFIRSFQAIVRWPGCILL